MKFLKSLLLSTMLVLFSCRSDACWYHTVYYNNYIFSINDVHREIPVANPPNSISYALTNNIVVDFPVTVTMKLTSERPIVFQALDGSSITNSITAMLQYRILPDGDWVTVKQYSIDSGRLPESYPPAPYLGRNNIAPKGLKKGDKLLIRLYVTDNATWQSGNLFSKCDRTTQIDGVDVPIYDLDFLRYTVTNRIDPDYEMGNGWLPHYLVTVIYSGNARPIK